MQVKLFQTLFFTLFVCTCALAQNITGTVTDGTFPLIGVSVRAIGSTSGAVTDLDGNYDLSVPSGADSLLFTYVGYRPVMRAINGQTSIDVVMGESAELLSEVVVVGYGVQQKDDLTGSVGVVEASEITDIPTQNLGQALQGKVSGLQIIPTSGAPGAEAVFRVRGIGTLNGDASPLFVVDGMIVNDINFINPNDVENVSVLKDASATAIYGARGANGVILITTKQGTGAGVGRVSISAYTGVQEVNRTLDLLNATEYATIVNEIDANEGRTPRYPNPESLGEGTNWQDEIFQTAPISSIQLAFQGGGDRGGFNLSANYFDQEGIIDGSGFQRFTTRLNTTREIKDYLKIGSNLSFIYSTSENLNAGGVLQGAYRADPLTSPRDSLGNFGNTSIRGNSGNPLATIFYNNNNEQNYRAVGNVYADVSFLRRFTFKTSFGLDFNYNFNRAFNPVFFVSANQQNQINDLNLFNSYNRNWLWENTLSYSNDFGVHHVDGVVGLTYQDVFGEFLSGERQDIQGETPSLLYLGLGDQMTATNDNGVTGDRGLESYLGRVNYDYDSRYLLTVSARVDGSSRFGSNFRYGFFPAVGVGWNVSSESFWDGGDLFSRLKVRSSWGVTGNDRIPNNAFTALINSGVNSVFGADEALVIGQTLTSLSNPNLRWEETTQTDVGIELGFFANKLILDVDYYRKLTEDVLYSPPIPDYVGAGGPIQNIATVLNRGVDVNLGWRETRSRFSYSISANASFVDNEVRNIDGEGGEFLAGGLGIGGIQTTRGIAGYPVGGYYGYELDGVFQNEGELTEFAQLGTQRVGDLRYRDQNGDGQINPSDDRVLLGSAIPDLLVGLNGSVSYAGVDLSFGFTSQFGNEIVNAKRAIRFGAYNQETFILDRFRGEGTSNTVPRPTIAGPNVENFSTRYIESGDYIRLRSLQLGYSPPAAFTERLRLASFRVYVNGTNLWTQQDYSGYNPEIHNGPLFDNGIDRGTIYPLSRVVTFGLDASF